jgi:hypothetical protein
MSQNRSHAANRLLASLPEEEYQRLEPHLSFVSLPLGKVFYEALEKIEYIYFPETALISLVNLIPWRMVRLLKLV